MDYNFRYFYGWIKTSTKRGGFVEDGEMAELHAAGYAKEYKITGSYEMKVEWSKGQRINAGVVFGD